MEEFELAKKAGFELAPYQIINNEKELEKLKIRFPVALKLISKEITHKTDKGLVKLNIMNKEELKAAYQELKKYKGKIIVQKMIRDGVELIVGGIVDAQFGNMVVLGLGGIYVEIFRDVTARICPITEEDIDEMIKELKSHPIIEGARGKKLYIKGIKKAVLSMCYLLKNNKVKEVEVNPLICTKNECYAVDIRVVK